MEEYQFRLAKESDHEAITAFMRRLWGSRHPLIELPEFFDYYYRQDAAPGQLRFALCECAGQLAALTGYIPASRQPQPDVWASIWVADKAFRGSGLELMAALPQLLGCRTLACNNIRPETRPFYEFLGYTTGRMGHFYRLAPKAEYQLARIKHPIIPPAAGRAQLTLLATPEALAGCGFTPPQKANPYKDLWYLQRRYFHFPHQSYRLYTATLPGDARPQALLALRVIPAGGTAVLRLVDYLGEPDFFPQLGAAINRLMEEAQCEYADCYCAGIDADIMYQAGFAERTEGDENILPNYLTPVAAENTDYYYFTSQPENFLLFKADGDQDRPNLSLPSQG